MTYREFIIAIIAGMLCLILGVAIAPKKTGNVLDGFNNFATSFYCTEENKQGIKHLYCMEATHDVMQCLIFDSTSNYARLIGVEYVINEGKFNNLITKEKAGWYPNEFSVNSGLFVSSNFELPNAFERRYSKTLLLWDEAVPLQDVKYVNNFQKEGFKISPDLVKLRDSTLKIDSIFVANKRKQPYRR